MPQPVTGNTPRGVGPFNRIVIKDGNGYTESFPAQVAAATKPGTLVKFDSNGKFAVAGAGDDEARLFILGERDYIGEILNDAYNADDTGVGYEIIPNRTVQIRAAAATYVVGDPITCGANGYAVKASTAGERVIGHVDRALTVAATDLGTNKQLLTVRLGQGSVFTS